MTVPRQLLHPRGPELSRLAWGAWRVLESPETDTPLKLARLIDHCLGLGITTFDHADIYGGYAAEAAFGRALREWGGDRSRLELVTKCGICLVHPARPAHRVKHYDTSPAHLRTALEDSLRALGTDHVDLLLIHRPDPLMEADATARALDDLVAGGKVRHLGVSNHTPAQLDLLQSRFDRPLVTNQIELSITRTTPLTDGTLDQAQRLRFCPMAWSPLGGGLEPHTKSGSGLMPALEALAAEHGCDDPYRVALAWLLRLPKSPGARSRHQPHRPPDQPRQGDYTRARPPSLIRAARGQPGPQGAVARPMAAVGTTAPAEL